MIAGAVASGRVPADGPGDVWRSWTGPTSWVGGVLAVLTVSFLAATFLAADADRGGRQALADDIGAKAVWSGVVAGGAALAAAVAIELDAETLADGFHTRGLASSSAPPSPGSPPWCSWGGAAGHSLVSPPWPRSARCRPLGRRAVRLDPRRRAHDRPGRRRPRHADRSRIVFVAAAVTAVPALIWLFVLVSPDEWQAEAH